MVPSSTHYSKDSSSSAHDRVEYRNEVPLRIDAAFFKMQSLLLEDSVLASAPAFSKEWFKESIAYNAKGGKLGRCIAVSEGLAALLGRDLTEQEAYHANVLGWCLELMNASFQVADDIVDASSTRRGKPCWYKRPGVGTMAINDAYLFMTCISRIIKLVFKDHPSYMQLQEVFQEVTFRTATGQFIDSTTPLNKEENPISVYTIESYMTIAKNKSSWYTYYLPLACSVILASNGSNSSSSTALAEAEQIMVDMGVLYQIQNDFHDCYGDPFVVGKVGTDIEEGKNTWLICTALGVASEEQRRVILENLGRKEEAAVAAVKRVYLELGIEGRFRQYEDEMYSRLMEAIQKQSLPSEIFLKPLNKMYRRSK